MRPKRGGLAQEVARRRLRQFQEPSPEQIAAEDEEARKEGYTVTRLSGGISVWIKKYTEDAPSDEEE